MQTGQDLILILDFGSQLTQLIARRLREIHFYSEILPFHTDLEKIKALKPKGIILSGGPASVYEAGSPQKNLKEVLEIAPVLGICYGMQLLTKELGGVVERSDHREYGFNRVKWSKPLSPKIPLLQKTWMSHGDVVKTVPPEFEIVAMSEGAHPAAMKSDRAWAVQFHPEVAHTELGIELLKSFATDLCGAKAQWDAPSMKKALQAKALALVGKDEHILCGLSGGVDSSVVATLLTEVFGKERVHCVFVDNGLLRFQEFESVMKTYLDRGLNVTGVDASKEFLLALKGLTDPEKKRKAIGRVFIEVFEKSIASDPRISLYRQQIRWLAQGTLYPDVIESVSFSGGPSQTIKSHHNVGGLPEKMKLKLLEPVRELFKDEVRVLGKELGLPEEMLGRHPFPGPGLSIRVMGEVTSESLEILKKADHIFISKLREHNLYHKIWQAFCVLTNVKTVGVQGDGRTYDQVLALRAVTSIDGMTADWFDFESGFLREVSNEITNKVRGISRVVYDITSKPPSTIEWE